MNMRKHTEPHYDHHPHKLNQTSRPPLCREQGIKKSQRETNQASKGDEMNDNKDKPYCKDCDMYSPIRSTACCQCGRFIGPQPTERDQKIADEEESPLYTSKTPKAPEPTEFLADVPKLLTKDDRKILQECLQYGFNKLLLPYKVADELCSKLDTLTVPDPLPQTVPWDAKRFHEWFAEYRMEGCWVKSTDSEWKGVYTMDDTRIWLYDLCHTTPQSFLIADIVGVKSPDGKEVACVMEVGG